MKIRIAIPDFHVVFYDLLKRGEYQNQLNTIRVLIDRHSNPLSFLILGRASPNIIKKVSETLAGRIEFVELSGFDLGETGNKAWQKLWLHGGFPRSYLAQSNINSAASRQACRQRESQQAGTQSPKTQAQVTTISNHELPVSCQLPTVISNEQSD